MSGPPPDDLAGLIHQGEITVVVEHKPVGAGAAGVGVPDGGAVRTVDHQVVVGLHDQPGARIGGAARLGVPNHGAVVVEHQDAVVLHDPPEPAAAGLQGPVVVQRLVDPQDVRAGTVGGLGVEHRGYRRVGQSALIDRDVVDAAVPLVHQRVVVEV